MIRDVTNDEALTSKNMATKEFVFSDAIHGLKEDIIFDKPAVDRVVQGVSDISL